ncbi:hypothetical protein BHM03_00019348, partial [Ensete ventricosum]
SVTIDFDHYMVCSSYRPVQGDPHTGKPSDRYIPLVRDGTENLGSYFMAHTPINNHMHNAPANH